MRGLGAVLAVAAIAAAFAAPLPSAAFTFRFGPFYFHVPYFHGPYFHHHWYWRRHHVVHHSNGQQTAARSEAGPQAAAAPAAPAAQEGGLTSALLYPAAALPAIYDEVFWPPASSPWPFTYAAIFQTAFAKAASDHPDATICQQGDRGAAVIDRIGKEVRPTPAQQDQLQKLGGALGAAADALAKACPNDIPGLPVARLQLMQWQIEKLAQTLDVLRQPLQDFEHALTDNQRAVFATGLPTSAGAMQDDRPSRMVAACAVTPTTVDWSVERIALTVQPTDAQRDAMASLKQAFGGAASELDRNCPSSLPRSPSERLQIVEGRLDATWRAEVAIQVALGNFQSGLSDEQKARFDQMDFATAAR